MLHCPWLFQVKKKKTAGKEEELGRSPSDCLRLGRGAFESLCITPSVPKYKSTLTFLENPKKTK